MSIEAIPHATGTLIIGRKQLQLVMEAGINILRGTVSAIGDIWFELRDKP